MTYSLLGGTGIRVSKICFGTLTMAPMQRNLPDAQCGALLRHAFDRGINFLDTAQLYQNYAKIKAGIQHRPDVVIASKTYAHTAEHAIAAVEEARHGLDRDVIDIFLLHEQESIHTLRGHEAALSALFTLKAQGKIRAVGLSTHHIAGVEGAVAMGLDVVHPILNAAGLGICDGGRAQMEQAAASAHAAGLGVYTMKAFGGGNLHKRASDCLSYAFSLPYAHSVALGMQCTEEVDANIAFLEKGSFGTAAVAGRERSLHIDKWCETCYHCIDACAHGALQKGHGGAPVWHRDACVFCGYCAAKCPCFCIKVL